MDKTRCKIGVLALQGDFEAHLKALEELGVSPIEIRDLSALENCDGLVMPGGESTTLLKLLGEQGRKEIRRFYERGGVILGTCAGLILLAREVRDPAQESIGLLDVVVARNAWGRQVESFYAEGEWVGKGPLEMVFIRAPRIIEFGSGVTVLARYKGEPVMIRQDRILGATFHPELTQDRDVHEYFVDLIMQMKGIKGTAEPCQQ